MNHKRSFLCGMRDGLPIAVGYFAVSFAIGINASGAGMTPLQAALLSLLNVTSAGEAAGVSLIAAGTTYAELAITQLIINIRYLLMSCALSQKISPKTSLLHRLLMSYGITDEIFAISASSAGQLDPFYPYGAICVAVPGWTIGTLLGALFGAILPGRLVSALGVALYAMFIAIILPPARKNHVLALLVPLSMAASWLFHVVPILNSISEGFRIIILTVLIAGAAALFFPIREEARDAH